MDVKVNYKLSGLAIWFRGCLQVKYLIDGTSVRLIKHTTYNNIINMIASLYICHKKSYKPLVRINIKL